MTETVITVTSGQQQNTQRPAGDLAWVQCNVNYFQTYPGIIKLIQLVRTMKESPISFELIVFLSVVRHIPIIILISHTSIRLAPFVISSLVTKSPWLWSVITIRKIRLQWQMLCSLCTNTHSYVDKKWRWRCCWGLSFRLVRCCLSSFDWVCVKIFLFEIFWEILRLIQWHQTVGKNEKRRRNIQSN